MNLFILSLNFAQCAEWMFDKHISKIILEAAQMLSTAKRVLDPDNIDVYDTIVYRISHTNHPVSKWMRESYANYCWTLQLVDAMHAEWLYRYNHPSDKIHKSYAVCQYLRNNPPPLDSFPQQDLTQFAQAMPDEYKQDDPILAYRAYYQSPAKRKIAGWSRRNPPEWWITRKESRELIIAENGTVIIRIYK